jgi:hypothetical protein
MSSNVSRRREATLVGRLLSVTNNYVLLRYQSINCYSVSSYKISADLTKIMLFCLSPFHKLETLLAPH